MMDEIVEVEPLQPFRRWFDEAWQGETNAHAMSLATTTPDGRPSVRAVLLKGLDERGFVFYTNLESRKSKELFSNPHAALATAGTARRNRCTRCAHEAQCMPPMTSSDVANPFASPVL